MSFIKLNDVIAMTTLSKSTIYRLIKKGKFPHSIPVGDRAVAWESSAVLDWMELKRAESKGVMKITSE